ncbi:MAG TPA: serine/threonine-protein kinase, partial [Labilithrix sp.]|nr:serine/threonine-protein kinase [Labilithrix sp.]
MDAVAPVLPGEVLAGKYRVERVLGRGGMGIVVAARHLELDERVAIKFLLGEHSDGSAERFLREGRAAAKVKGEHVCRVFDFGRLDTGEPYIVMDHLEGLDLARKLDREGPQPAARVVGWVIEACDALADAHATGIVHRDLKPANIFLAERADGSTCAKILDFGISKLARAETMTGPATSMGSPVYMSPEQMESARDVDARSDVWSLGVLMYELIAGKPPFVGESMVQLTVMVRERREEPLELVAPGVPEGLARVVTRCLEKKPDDRFATVADLAGALAPYAPADVSALLARLLRRRTSDPALALARTSPDCERQTPLPMDRTETSQAVHLAGARGTFAPVLSSVAQREPLAHGRWSRSVIGALLLVLGAGSFAASSLRSRDQVTPGVAAAAVATTAPAGETAPVVLPVGAVVAGPAEPPAAQSAAPVPAAPKPARPAISAVSPADARPRIAGGTPISAPVASAASSQLMAP